MNNDEFTLKGTLKTGTSQKGNEYTYLELRLNKDYSKRVFLEQAEIVLLKTQSDDILPFPKKM